MTEVPAGRQDHGHAEAIRSVEDILRHGGEYGEAVRTLPGRWPEPGR